LLKQGCQMIDFENLFYLNKFILLRIWYKKRLYF
jgi:hypothetical protein